MYSINNPRSSEGGFTLVELAIVMIIIGLLIAGVLKGQELIGNARVTATVAQIKGIDGAVSTFKDMYSAFPGDMLTPATRLPNCTGGCATAGDGDGHLEANPSAIPTQIESINFFRHLSAADIITGVDQNAAASAGWGQRFPAARINGGLFPSYSQGGAAAGLVANGVNALGGTYLTLTTNPATAPGAGTGAISPNQAFRMDSKLDDGNPATGATRAFGTGCVTATGYDEASSAQVCGLHMRIQG